MAETKIAVTESLTLQQDVQQQMNKNIQEMNATIMDVTRKQIELTKETAQIKERYLNLETRLNGEI